MFINIIKSCRDVVAVCDKELIGKVFEEDRFQLDIKENFYKGEEMSEEKVIDLLKFLSTEDATFNIVGKKSVNAALKAGVITEENVNEIQNIPFALILL
ncbi:MAG: DUF424 family protein [Nanoarchaeota archaeon]|nr:DUF424 family protein [Nanoarchaeota archaeon]